MGLGLNNLQKLICPKTHPTKPNQTKLKVHLIRNIFTVLITQQYR